MLWGIKFLPWFFMLLQGETFCFLNSKLSLPKCLFELAFLLALSGLNAKVNYLICWVVRVSNEQIRLELFPRHISSKDWSTGTAVYGIQMYICLERSSIETFVDIFPTFHMINTSAVHLCYFKIPYILSYVNPSGSPGRKSWDSVRVLW